MSDMERFDACRKRLWKLLADTDMAGGCKSYEGTLEIRLVYPNFFESPMKLPEPDAVRIKLDCYVLGPTRHYDFLGETFSAAIMCFEDWLDEREAERKSEG